MPLFESIADISSNEESSSATPGPFQVICKYPSDESLDNEDLDSIEAEIKTKHFSDQAIFHTIRPGYDNMEDENLVIGEFSIPKGIDRNLLTNL